MSNDKQWKQNIVAEKSKGFGERINLSQEKRPLNKKAKAICDGIYFLKCIKQ